LPPIHRKEVSASLHIPNSTTISIPHGSPSPRKTTTFNLISIE
ncbi:unnamed protein product, partial [Rotaria magnacalcarata]